MFSSNMLKGSLNDDANRLAIPLHCRRSGILKHSAIVPDSSNELHFSNIVGA